MTTSARYLPPEAAYVTPELDAVQHAIVRWNGRDSMTVLGAPGSGKTTALIELVAAALDAEILDVDSVLVLTPQRLAANRLRAALAERVRRATPGPLARTPMSVALEIATQSALAAADIPPRLLTGAEQDRIIAQLLEGQLADGDTSGAEMHRAESGAWPHTLGPAVRSTRVFRNELRDLIDRCIDLGLTPQGLADLGRTHNVPEWVSAASFWGTELNPVLDTYRFGFADSAEIMQQAAAAVAADSVAPRYRAVFVDDAQELTFGVLALLSAFAGRGVPLVLFGNPDQATTTFRGAVPDIMGRAAERLGISPVEHVLPQVYRHGADLRQVVSTVEARIGAATAGPQRAAVSSPLAPATRVSVITATSRAGESASVARALRRAHVRDGIDWSRMAVVVRQGSLVDSVARLLSANDVPTRTLVNEQALRDQPLVREFLGIIRLAHNVEELTSARAEAFLAGDIAGMSAIDIRRLRLILRHAELAEGGSRTGPELLRDALVDPDGLFVVEAPPVVAARRAARVLSQVRDLLASGGTIEEILWAIWSASPLPSDLPRQAHGVGVVAEQANRRLDTVLALFAAARRFVEREPQRAALDFVTDLLHTDVPEDTLAPSSGTAGVLVCTPTALVGAECDVVAVMSLQEGVWPNLRPRGQLFHNARVTELVTQGSMSGQSAVTLDDRLAVLHDELRMFTLACSRARLELVVSATRSDDDTVSPFHRLVETQVARASEAAGSDSHSGDGLLQTHGGDLQTDDYALSLSGITGWLRRRLAQEYDVAETTSEPRDPGVARSYARLVAHLARNGVPAADPRDWYGVADPSTRLPLVTADEIAAGKLVSISPSRLEAWTENPFGWFLDGTVGGDQTVATGVGTLVHKAFEMAGADLLPDLTADTLWGVVRERWHELSFETDWLADREQRRAEVMVRNLAGYLAELRDQGVEIIGVECSFAFDVGTARLHGRIDQVHRHADGTVSIADLKTGAVAKTAEQVATNPQLQCYQLALVRDAIRSETPDPDTGEKPIVAEGAESGGASLVYVNGSLVAASKTSIQRRQDPVVRGGAEHEAIEASIAEAATGMAGDSFEAIVFTREERSEYASRYLRRIHTVGSVSSA